MTHDELLRNLNYEIGLGETNGTAKDLSPYYALRAVVELHKPRHWQNPNVPEWNGAICTHCLEERGDYMSPIEASYPCPTIQAIEKEL